LVDVTYGSVTFRKK